MRNTCLFLLLIIVSFSLTACSQSDEHEAQGYIEGTFTYVATPVSGVLKQVMVSRGTRVAAGDVLFTLDSQPEIDAYEVAREQLDAARAEREAIIANLTFAKQTYERNSKLAPKQAIEQSELDRSVANLKALEAQLIGADAKIKGAQADVRQAKWLLDQKTAVAPVDALVFDTYYELGEFTEANHAIVSLLPPSGVKAIFYVPEPHLATLKLGDDVDVMCDRCERVYTGNITFISPVAEYTPPVIYSTETNSKLVYRIEAVFNAFDAMRLHPGQPVQVAYDINDK